MYLHCHCSFAQQLHGNNLHCRHHHLDRNVINQVNHLVIVVVHTDNATLVTLHQLHSSLCATFTTPPFVGNQNIYFGIKKNFRFLQKRKRRKKKLNKKFMLR
uniref:Uncharacterized protein n=1 Tax=Ceratitis capitata TaxID=7213 RepID=W8C4C6_CERCA